LDEIPVETGRRAVTENISGIIALSKACELAAEDLEEVNSNKVNTYYTKHNSLQRFAHGACTRVGSPIDKNQNFIN